MLCLVAHTASAESPTIAAELGFGLRGSSTSQSHYAAIYDDTPSLRHAADGFLGVRLNRFAIGLHAGVASPLNFYSSPQADSNEQVPSMTTEVYPIDIGAAAVVETDTGFWASAWLGPTIAIAHASSPAQFVAAIDYYGQIPEATWKKSSTSLGGGATIGFDLVKRVYGRLAATGAVEYQNIGPIANRANDGRVSESEALTSISVTIGIAYRY